MPPQRKKIVVVDDDTEILNLTKLILADLYNVKTADNGADGLVLIKKERPDLVVLDLLMPRMHGYEVCQRLRADPAFKTLKILISSSKSYANDIDTAKKAGADSYIVKPFSIDDLLNKVNELLGSSKSASELIFWGTRGSIPSPGSETVRYGGNTSCVELRLPSGIILIDAGSGIREWGNAAMAAAAGKKIEANLFIGHTHWDHIQGFPFCTPLYIPGNSFKVFGVHGTTQSFDAALTGQMDSTYFPVPLKQMASDLEFVEINAPVKVCGVKASYHYLNHPGITVGYRFEGPGWTACYISDHEPYAKLNAKGAFSDKEDAAVAKFVEGADVLICESQYTDEEYRSKRSWGHSTFTDVAALATAAKVKKLVLFHHDPVHTDEMMDRYVESCQKQLAADKSPIECLAAQEGATIPLEPLGPKPK